MHIRFASALIFAACLCGAQAKASTIVWDYSPQTLGFGPIAGSSSNQSNGQNFLDAATFANPVKLTGMDIYTQDNLFVSVGASFVEKIFSSVLNAPGVSLYNFSGVLSAIDNDGATPGNIRLHGDFAAPVSLSAGTYYFGMSGAGNTELGQVILTGYPAGTGNLFILNGDTINTDRNGYDTYRVAFRLEGDGVSNVPLPATLPLFGTALAGLGFLARRRRVS